MGLCPFHNDLELEFQSHVTLVFPSNEVVLILANLEDRYK